MKVTTSGVYHKAMVPIRFTLFMSTTTSILLSDMCSGCKSNSMTLLS